MEDREKISRGSSDRMEGIGRSVRRRKAEGLPETAAGRAVRYQIPGERKRRTSTVSDSSVVREASDRARRTGESMPGTGRIRGAAGPDRARRRRSPGREDQAIPGRVPRRPGTAGMGDRRQASRKMQAKRRRKRNLGLKIALFILFIIAAAAAIFLWKRYSPSKEKADRKEYYGIENENQMAVIIDNEIVEPHGMMSDGKAYLQYELVRDYVNGRFYWDPNENVLLYTLPNDTVSVEVGSKEYMVSKKKDSMDYVILKTEGSTAYIALDFIQKYTNIDFQLYQGPDRVMIVKDWGEKEIAEVKKNTQVRCLAGVKSKVLTEVSKKDEVTVIEDEGDWKKVRTKDGFIGYAKNSALRPEEKKTLSRDFEEPEYTSIKKDYIINMAWHNVTNTDANEGVLQRIAESKGLTTISPTWFHVQDVKGNIESIASSDYVNYAHQANIEVWGALRDFDGGISSYDESYELLSRTSSRENLINQVIAEALQVGIDGINVDFELISEECGEHYIQFIRELSVRCRQNSIVLSVDNYVPQGYNMQYNRREQGIVADYVIIMGYDEHYGGSPEAGSVASLNYVKTGIEETLKEVPAEKIISGVPFFTRLWSERPKTEEELAEDQGTEAAEYSMKVTSEALGMEEAQNRIKEAGAEAVWDEETQQNFATWESEGETYKIWLEDTDSLEQKLKLMKDNGLAGTAAWALGQEDSKVWKLIQKYTN